MLLRILLQALGTDGLRLWVASIDYAGEAVVSDVLLRNVQEVYRKIRNTCRFLVSNIYDFDYQLHAVSFDQLRFVDHHALATLFNLQKNIISYYNAYDFTAIFHALADYCTVTLSSFYLDVIKDRLYVEQAQGLERRAAQTVCWYLLDVITRLTAPVLSFTAEQLSDHYQKNKKESIHLQQFFPLEMLYKKVEHTLTLNEMWDFIIQMRNALLKAIEQKREEGLVKHSLEAKLNIYGNFSSHHQVLFNQCIHELKRTQQTPASFFKELLIVSHCSYESSAQGLEETQMAGLYALVSHAEGNKCPRCWQWDTAMHDHDLCRRCYPIVG